MKKSIKPENRRLLEALYYIDEEVLSDALSSVRIPEPVSPVPRKKRIVVSVKYAAALVACAVLMGALIPAISMLIGNIAPIGSNFGDGISPSGGESENLETEPDNLTDESNGAEETGAPTERVSDGSEGLEYEINADGETASFIGFGTCTDENVVIATTFMGLPVTQMRNEAFLCGMDTQYCGSRYAKSIKVSDTVESIYQGIFDVCPNLESIYIGTNVNFIRPFVANTSEGYNLAEIKVSPDNVYFSDNGNCLFEKQSKTLIVSCKNSVIPDDGSVEIIGSMAFSLYPKKSIVIPEGVKRIEVTAFSDSELEYVALPKSLSYLGAHVFESCKNLKEVDLNGFSELPQGIFHNCDSLYKIIGLEKVTFIGGLALSSCESLIEITLGADLTEIGDQAFYSNVNMTTINFAGNAEQWNAIKKGAGWNTLMNDPDWHEKIPVEFINCSDGKAQP